MVRGCSLLDIQYDTDHTLSLMNATKTEYVSLAVGSLHVDNQIGLRTQIHYTLSSKIYLPIAVTAGKLFYHFKLQGRLQCRIV